MIDVQSLGELQQAARRHWREVALSTKPIEKARAADAVQALYTAATGRPPDHVLFFDSPVQAEIAATFFTFNHPNKLLGRDGWPPLVARVVADSIRMDAITTLPPGATIDEIPQLEQAIRAALSAAYHVGPDRAVFMRAFDALSSQLSPQVRSLRVLARPRYKGWLRRVKRSGERWVSLRPWIAWAAHHSIRRGAFPDRRMFPREQLISAVIDVVRECGSCWFYSDTAIVADRPPVLRLDQFSRLHADDGPALAYRDGFSINALHGVRVDRSVIERPDKITVTDVENEENAEVRRALVERMGLRRYLSMSGAVPVASDETGTLWRRRLPNRRGEGRRAWCFVEVVNGSREPDGSYKHYFLRVPPTMRAAREAVAWTYGLTTEAYQPRVRT